jgi:hypothetical protein
MTKIIKNQKFFKITLSAIFVLLSLIIIYLVIENNSLANENAKLVKEVETLSGKFQDGGPALATEEKGGEGPLTEECTSEYKNDQYGFSLDLPCKYSVINEDLSQAEKGVLLDAGFESEEQKKFGILITSGPENNSIDALQNELKEKGINETELMRIGDLESIMYTTNTDDQSKNIVAIMPVGIFKYEFYLSSQGEGAEDLESEFRFIVESMKFMG